jgi:hypothetical protein
MSERILTLHPGGKKGVNIDKDKYDKMKLAILKILHDEGSVTLEELRTKLTKRLKGKFQGGITWYMMTVKLDLEARGVIERIPESKPQRLRFKD